MCTGESYSGLLFLADEFLDRNCGREFDAEPTETFRVTHRKTIILDSHVDLFHTFLIQNNLVHHLSNVSCMEECFFQAYLSQNSKLDEENSGLLCSRMLCHTSCRRPPLFPVECYYTFEWARDTREIWTRLQSSVEDNRLTDCGSRGCILQLRMLQVKINQQMVRVSRAFLIVAWFVVRWQRRVLAHANCWSPAVLNCLFSACNLVHQSRWSLTIHHYLFSDSLLRWLSAHVSFTHRVLLNWMTVLSYLATNFFNPDHLIAHAVSKLHWCNQRNEFQSCTLKSNGYCGLSFAACTGFCGCMWLGCYFFVVFLVQVSSGQMHAAGVHFHTQICTLQAAAAEFSQDQNLFSPFLPNG